MSKLDLSRGEMWFFGLLAIALALVMLGSRPDSRSEALVPSGTPLPEIMAGGWINAPTLPSRESLAGQVVLIDCWATWCPPCRATMPHLAKLHEKYEPLGVKFIGLTSQSSADRTEIETFIDSVSGFHWPVGYGAAPTLEMLGIRQLPTVIVFSTNGLAVWSGGTNLSGIENALDEALAFASK